MTAPTQPSHNNDQGAAQAPPTNLETGEIPVPRGSGHDVIPPRTRPSAPPEPKKRHSLLWWVWVLAAPVITLVLIIIGLVAMAGGGLDTSAPTQPETQVSVPANGNAQGPAAGPVTPVQGYAPDEVKALKLHEQLQLFYELPLVQQNRAALNNRERWNNSNYQIVQSLNAWWSMGAQNATSLREWQTYLMGIAAANTNFWNKHMGTVPTGIAQLQKFELPSSGSGQAPSTTLERTLTLTDATDGQSVTITVEFTNDVRGSETGHWRIVSG